jgi:DeoR family transcriptional regulator, suf operon transcriptional repressor
MNKYVLTDKGIGCFPKQYAWFSELMLDDLQQENPEKFTGYMQRLGIKLADKLKPRFAGKVLNERVDELLVVMDDLGFRVHQAVNPDTGDTEIIARNCIYHELAQKHHEICSFDVALISSLVEQDITHTSCMATGACHCCFAITKN